MSVFSWWSNWFGKGAGREVVSPARLSLEEQALRTHEIARAKAEKAEIEAERAEMRQRDMERAEAKKGVVGSLAIARQEAEQAAASAQEAKEVLAGRRASYEALLEATSGHESDPIVMGTRSRAVEEGHRVAAEANALISVAAGWDAKVVALEAEQRALLAEDLQNAGMSTGNAEWAASKTWEEHQIEAGKGPEERLAERREQAAAQRMSSWLTPEEGRKALQEWSKAIDELTALREVREAWEAQDRNTPPALRMATNQEPAVAIGTEAAIAEEHWPGVMWDPAVDLEAPHLADELDASREMFGVELYHDALPIPELKPVVEALAPADPPTWEASQQHEMAKLSGLQEVADREGWEPEPEAPAASSVGDILDELGATVSEMTLEERAKFLTDDGIPNSGVRWRLADPAHEPILGPGATITGEALRAEAVQAEAEVQDRLHSEIEAAEKVRMAEIEGRAEVARQWAEYEGPPMAESETYDGSPMTPDPAEAAKVASRTRESDQLKAEQARQEIERRRRAREAAEEQEDEGTSRQPGQEPQL